MTEKDWTPKQLRQELFRSKPRLPFLRVFEGRVVFECELLVGHYFDPEELAADSLDPGYRLRYEVELAIPLDKLPRQLWCDGALEFAKQHPEFLSFNYRGRHSLD
jgi:hypothetical protein